MRAVVDDGAMANALNVDTYEAAKAILGELAWFPPRALHGEQLPRAVNMVMKWGGQPGGVWRRELLEAELCEWGEDTLALSGKLSRRRYTALFRAGLRRLLVVPLALGLAVVLVLSGTPSHRRSMCPTPPFFSSLPLKLFSGTPLPPSVDALMPPDTVLRHALPPSLDVPDGRLTLLPRHSSARVSPAFSLSLALPSSASHSAGPPGPLGYICRDSFSLFYSFPPHFHSPTTRPSAMSQLSPEKKKRTTFVENWYYCETARPLRHALVGPPTTMADRRDEGDEWAGPAVDKGDVKAKSGADKAVVREGSNVDKGDPQLWQNGAAVGLA
ncbi:hypothetical protein B0H14DRAFT_3671462 [Mycena olivaceomarginata]|nr:hypothetical protein B0H14DRAFT_3671462 [Mycena olivaceomarginata]